MGERCSVEFGGKASVNFLSKILSVLPRSFGDCFNTSCHTNCCPKTHFLSQASLPGVLASDQHPFSPISSDEKGTTSGFRVLANHLASFFVPHLPLSYYLFGLLYWPLYPLLCPTNLGLWSADSLTSIRYFVQQVGRGVDIHSYSSFNGQSLGSVNSNTEG